MHFFVLMYCRECALFFYRYFFYRFTFSLLIFYSFLLQYFYCIFLSASVSVFFCSDFIFAFAFCFLFYFLFLKGSTMHHLVKKVTIVSALAMTCNAAFANDAITTKVLAVDGGLVTLAIEGANPAWLAKGNMIQTGSWQARVHAVDNGTFVIALPKTNAARLTIDSNVTVKAFAREESFGC
jgi:hypothetical protein